MDPDYAALEKFMNGDAGAFHCLVTRYQKPLYAFIYRMVGNQEDAMDLCQKTFVQVFLKVGRFERRSSFKTWLSRIAVNVSQNHLRANGRNPVGPLPLYMAIENIPSTDRKTALDALISNEEEDLLRSAVRELPEKQRITLLLRVYQELSFDEIATVMQCPVGAARVNYHHAVSSLRKNMGGKNGL